jgi:hypothetical protein
MKSGLYEERRRIPPVNAGGFFVSKISENTL